MLLMVLINNNNVAGKWTTRTGKSSEDSDGDDRKRFELRFRRQNVSDKCDST